MANANHIQMPEGFGLQAFDVLDSTNEEARRLTAQKPQQHIWVQADSQSAGRGRRGREWVSEQGNLFCSLLWKADCDLKTASQLSFVTALAVRDVVADLMRSDLRVTCKWPNDILVDDRKISGILLETAGEGLQDPDYVIIGIGINLQNCPDETIYPATSIAQQGGQALQPLQVLQLLAKSQDHWMGEWRNKGFAHIRKVWLARAKGLGQTITVRLPNEEINGRFIDLDVTGGLKVETENGTRIIAAGDVFFAPAG
ncbi:biotin--[acetyl-CoA-carboxylase] ligase [Emcibacter sp.]|uniref:biotin--[acetyl-CoA-carboxylase] ligase n=1 Tax=Emcibacter sp. TaxID=1979954 RepID=UPI002AA6BFB6|nr:biotin--[acetyl-CoA-carboxylase] ligase [Emcibacter sp.]